MRGKLTSVQQGLLLDLEGDHWWDYICARYWIQKERMPGNVGQTTGKPFCLLSQARKLNCFA